MIVLGIVQLTMQLYSYGFHKVPYLKHLSAANLQFCMKFRVQFLMQSDSEGNFALMTRLRSVNIDHVRHAKQLTAHFMYRSILLEHSFFKHTYCSLDTSQITFFPFGVLLDSALRVSTKVL